MGLIKEPLDVDFFVMPGDLSVKEKEMISAHINAYKAKAAKRKESKKPLVKSKKQGERLAQ